MKQILILMPMLALFIGFSLGAAYATDVHVIAQAQDKDTEIEVKVNNKHHTEVLDKGVNFLRYKCNGEPKVRILAYGDKTFPKLKKARGEWYTFVEVKPPKDGDTE